MPILYGMVARDTTVLVEYATTSSTAGSTIGRKILQKLPSGDHKKSYTYEGHFFHYHADANGLVVLLMADGADQSGTRLAFSCIADIRTSFLGMCPQWGVASEGSLNDVYLRSLRQKIEYYSNPIQSDSVARARTQIDEVQNLMKDNLNKVIKRGDNIETLVERTDELQESIVDFHSSSVKLRRQLWWQNAKFCIAFWVILAIIILVIVLIILGKLGKL